MGKEKANSFIPTVLSFEKKIAPSNGMFFSTKWESRHVMENNFPLKIVEKSIRGTISNRLDTTTTSDEAKLKNKIEEANLQTVDTCNLLLHNDTLHMYFSLKFFGNIKTPSTCNLESYREKYENIVEEYIKKEKFEELGLRYAINIANGRFLWRNRVGSDKIEVCVENINNNKKWTFNCLDFCLHNFETDNNDVKELGKYISDTLSSENGFLNLNVDAYVCLGHSQEVYPSEELVLDKDKSKDKTKNKGKKSKILFSISGIAGMHSQKIGNAIRTIDTWYDEYDNTKNPIAIETYGSVTNKGIAYRQPKNDEDFYSIFDNAIKKGSFKSIKDAHYSMAMIIRGGVFGDAKDKS